MHRVFVALWPTAATRAALAAAQQALPWPAAARQVNALQLHLTLAFIGAVSDEQMPVVRQAAGVASAPIGLVLDRLELWKGGIAVLGPAGVPAALAELQSRLAGSLQAQGVGFDARPFAPHVTLARKARGLPAAPLLPLQWQSTGHVLVRSAGGLYTVIARYA